jgi:alpha-glucosidase
MRLYAPQTVTLQSHFAHQLHFKGGYGEALRVSVLDEGIIRVQHLPDGVYRLDRTWAIVSAEGDMPRAGRHRDDLSSFALPEYDAHITDERITLQTQALDVTITLGAFQIEVADQAGQVFHRDSPRIAYNYHRGGRDVFHYVERQRGEHYYGFGERAGDLSKVGRRMRMVNLDAIGYESRTTDPLYKHCAFYITFDPMTQIAYGLFYDNYATTTFDMGAEMDAYRGAYRYYHADDGDLDYYLLYGEHIADVLERYTRLTGRPSLPPRWALGYLGSTMSYTEADNAQEQLKQFAQLCRQHDIPCDLFHLSSGYTTSPEGNRYVFTWNRDKVPDPQQMVDDFHAAGIRLTPNVKPYLLDTHPLYTEVAQQGGFIQQAEADAPEISRFWAGGLNMMGDGSYLDFTSAVGYDWWQTKLRAHLLDYGIDAVWNDNNEFQLWDDAARCAGFGDPLPIGLARPLQALLMGHASYHALLDKYPDQRPFVVSRSGGAGIQRYAQTWSGDNTTSWEDFRYNIPMTLGASLSGMPSHGNDVGGFFGAEPEPELLLRWVQNHVFHPRFCIHSWNVDGSVTEPWMYPDVLPHIRAAIHLRYRLLPYLYTLFVQAHRDGRPIVRPLVYHFPQDARCHTESFDFMLGEHLLVPCVAEAGMRQRELYLPAGAMWCDFYTGDWHAGGQTITIDTPLARLPLFVRDGGMIPMGKLMTYIGAQADDERQVYLYPHPERASGASSAHLIEDDGLSLAYQRGDYTQLTMHAQATPEQVAVQVDRDAHRYSLPYDEIIFILPPNDKRTLVGGDHITSGDNRQRISIKV